MPPLKSVALSVVDLYLVKTGFILLNFNPFKNIYIKLYSTSPRLGFHYVICPPFQ